MTATARLAHYVFGCKLSLEKPGTSRTAEGQLDVPFAQYTPALLAARLRRDRGVGVLLGARAPHAHAAAARAGRSSTSTASRPPDEYLDFTHRGSRVPLDEVRKHPGGRVFEPDEPVGSQPRAARARGGAHERRRRAAVIEQLRAIRAERSPRRLRGDALQRTG